MNTDNIRKEINLLHQNNTSVELLTEIEHAFSELLSLLEYSKDPQERLAWYIRTFDNNKNHTSILNKFQTQYDKYQADLQRNPNLIKDAETNLRNLLKLSN